jgi:glycosyltransferase involved in cell wall biosynthesis
MYKNKVILITHVNPLRAYSGIKYLCESLAKENVKIELWANIPRNSICETKKWDFPVHSFMKTWYGQIPKFRYLMTLIHIMIICIFRSNTIITHDFQYFHLIVFIKKIFPYKKVIHYCTEIFTENEVPLKFYKKYADLPDLIIDVEPTRAELRKKWYSLSKDPLIILNTIPNSDLPRRGSPGCLARLANIDKTPITPIILYTGGVFEGRGFNIIIQALKDLKVDTFFLAFVYGNKNAIKELIELCKENLNSNNFKICDSVSREEILSCSYEASVGLVYYPPSDAIGNQYAAPTKFFEYIACGIPVISAPNESLIKLFKQYNIGSYAEDESSESLTKAIEFILKDKEIFNNIRTSLPNIFNENLCYEVVSKKAIEELTKFIKEIN